MGGEGRGGERLVGRSKGLYSPKISIFRRITQIENVYVKN